MFLRGRDGLTVTDVTADVVEAYTAELMARGISGASVNCYLRTVRTLCGWIARTYGIPRVPVPMIRADAGQREGYTEAELERLLAKPNLNKCSFSEFRAWAAVNFLIGTGCRLRSLVEVRIGDLDFAGGYIRLAATKNRRPIVVPMSAGLSGVLREYLAVRGGEAGDVVFCAERGEPATTHSYQQLIRRYNRKRGVDRTSVHAFRHAFARLWLVNGGDVFRLQRILGHSTLDVTRGYVALYGPDLKAGFDSFSPLDTVLSGERRGDVIRMPRRR